jgi:hypothetical protein
LIECFSREGGDCSGDEEEAGQEGCPEEKEVRQIQFHTLGAAPPSGPHTLFYIIMVRQGKIFEKLNSFVFI